MELGRGLGLEIVTGEQLFFSGRMLFPLLRGWLEWGEGGERNNILGQAIPA